MTKLQKQKQFVRSEFGKVMTADNYGHFKHNKYRIKMKKTSFRMEIKINKDWMRVSSVYYKDATEVKIKQFINYIFTASNKLTNIKGE